jgi:hypothetical protein
VVGLATYLARGGRGGRRGLRALPRPLMLSLLVTAGCYSYQPIATAPTPPAGEELRVHLNEQGTAELTRYLGPRVVTVDARLLRIEQDSILALGVSVFTLADGSSYPFTGQDPVPVSRTLISSMERRTFSRGRTVVVSTGLVAGLVAIAHAALRTGHVEPGGGGGGPPPP